MSSPTSSWSISVKTVGGSDSVRAAKASSSQESSSNNKISLDCDGSSINSDTSSIKDPPVNLKSHHRSNSSNSSVQMIDEVPSNFTVNVQSSDELSMLHTKIEEVTGLQASQQRLIYRGRLITKQAANSSKDVDLIGDIEGLCDGQTIHLVPRPLPNTNISNNTGNARNVDGENGNSTRPRSNSAGSSTTSGNGASAATSLIATLLGLSVPSNAGSSNSNNSISSATVDEDLDSLSTRPYQSSNSSSSRDRRRQMISISNSSNNSSASRRSSSSNNNNVTSSRRGARNRGNAYNTGVWERNPVEPLRQGLMTLHTLLETHPSNNATIENIDGSIISSEKTDVEQDEEDLEERKMSYLEVARKKQDSPSPVDRKKTKCKKQKFLPLPPKWYLGQWLDVKDTVDQWLEATIDKIVLYTDIFTPDQIHEYESNASLVGSATEKEEIRKHNLKVDPIVGAGDKEGCKSLFLEEMPNYLDESGFPLMKFKDDYKNTQLILVHYNSWPHRWDEWIRGDSKRISIFRTKTRHSPSAPFASPTPNSHYFEAPTTYITPEGEYDNVAIIPELCLAMNKVQRILSATPYNGIETNVTNQSTPSCLVASDNAAMSNSTNILPWGGGSNRNFNNNIPCNSNDESSQNQGLVQDLKEDPGDTENINILPSTILKGLSREQLGSLAPILDRLGRTLTDIAPHIAELSSSLPSGITKDSDSKEDAKKPDANSDDPSKAQSTTEQTANSNVAETNEESTESRLSETLNATIVEELERPENDSSTEPRGGSNSSHSPAIQQSNPNPHHPHADRYHRRSTAQLQTQNDEPIDYALSLVNTSRDENPTRRSRQSTSNQDLPSSFLGTYLAARGVSEEDRDAGSTLARLLRVGSGGLAGSDANGGGGGSTGNGGGGIDIHIHAIVTPVGGGGGMDVGIGLPDIGAFPFIGVHPVSQDESSTSGAEAGASSSALTGETVEEGNSPILNNVDVPDLDDDLFSDSYTESPTPFEFARNEIVEENESNDMNDNTNAEETPPLTAYSMAVGDIPTLSTDEIVYVEASAASADIIEENTSVNNETATTISSVINVNASPSSSLSNQVQPTVHQDTPTLQSSSMSSSYNSNMRGRTRNGSAFGRLARAFRRNQSSRGTGSNGRNI